SIKFNVRFIVWRRFRGRPQWPQPIHTHHPCDENTDPLREMPIPVPRSNKSVLKAREKLWRKEMSLKPRQKGGNRHRSAKRIGKVVADTESCVKELKKNRNNTQSCFTIMNFIL